MCLGNDLADCVTSFLLNYDIINPELAFTHGSVLTSCKLLSSAVQRTLCDYVWKCTSKRWGGAPKGLLNAVFTDALRLKINGVTQRMALAIRVPRATLDDLEFDVVKVAPYCSAHVFSLRDVLSVLSEQYLYREYRLPHDVRSSARPVKRGLYIQEEAKKRRRIDLDERRKKATEQRRRKLEAHPDWPIAVAAYNQINRHDIFGDFLVCKVTPSTKLNEVIERGRQLSFFLKVLHPDDIPQDLSTNATLVVQNSVQDVLHRVIGVCAKRKSGGNIQGIRSVQTHHCGYKGCCNKVSNLCPLHMCGRRCPGCVRHIR